MPSQELVILDGVRTPFLKSGSDAKDLQAADLGKQILQALFKQVPVKPEQVDEIIFGCVAQPFDQANVTRVAQIKAGLPLAIPSYTVHRNCSSSMQSVTNACESIAAGRAKLVLAGGMESLSNTPLVYSRKATAWFGKLSRAKTLGQRLGLFAGAPWGEFFKPRISLMEGLTDPTCGLNMGQTAEVLANEFGLSRTQQDQFSVDSHLKAAKAQAAGRFDREIAPLFCPPSMAPVAKDNGIRADSSLEKLAKLKTVFAKEHGTVTAGNASQITDGAVALVVTTMEQAQAMGVKPLAVIKGQAYAGLDPQRMGLGPVYSTGRLFRQLGLTMKQMDVVEINEAFAAQVLACLQAFASEEISVKRLGLDKAAGELDPAKLNVNGGAIALGHPVGSSGGRLLLTLAHELIARDKQIGLATLCVGGGQGAAFVLERNSQTR
jgi:acetyl-CoA C-acetyltransferase/acetyl-CoA acyltransferase